MSSVCLSVVCRLWRFVFWRNGLTDLHEIFREGVEWAWDDLITFWINSDKPRDAAMLIYLSSVVCDVLFSGETAGPICMKFSGKVWSDHGTTCLHFGSNRVNRAMPITRKRLDRFAWMHHSFCIDLLLWGSRVGHPSDSWASCHVFSLIMYKNRSNKYTTLFTRKW